MESETEAVKQTAIDEVRMDSVMSVQNWTADGLEDVAFPHLMRKVHGSTEPSSCYSVCTPHCVLTITCSKAIRDVCTHTPTLQLWTFSVTQLTLTLHRGVAVLWRCRQVAAIARLSLPFRLTGSLEELVMEKGGGNAGLQSLTRPPASLHVLSLPHWLRIKEMFDTSLYSKTHFSLVAKDADVILIG